MTTPSLLDKLAKLKAKARWEEGYPFDIVEDGETFRKHEGAARAKLALKALYNEHGPALVAALDKSPCTCYEERSWDRQLVEPSFQCERCQALAAMECAVDKALGEE